MIKLYLAPFVVAALISGGLTFYVKLLAQKFNLADYPSPRKIHTEPTPRLGGVAIVLTVLGMAVIYNLISHRLDFTPFKTLFLEKRFLGTVIGALILLVVGILDDVRGIKPWKKLFWHLLAAVTVVIFGVGISYIRIPGGITLHLDSWVIPINLLGGTYQFVVWGDLLTIVWIVLLINTLNFFRWTRRLGIGCFNNCGYFDIFLKLFFRPRCGRIACTYFCRGSGRFLAMEFSQGQDIFR